MPTLSTTRVGAALGVVATVVVACAALADGRSREVTPGRLDGPWPLTVDRAVLRCDEDRVTVDVTNAHGRVTTWALNSRAEVERPPLPDWLLREHADLGVLIAAGRELCPA